MKFVNTFDSSPNYNIDKHIPALTQTPDLQPADASEFIPRGRLELNRKF
jgi:hypothetical protein